MKRILTLCLVLAMALTTPLSVSAAEDAGETGEPVSELRFYLDESPLCGQEIRSDSEENQPSFGTEDSDAAQITGQAVWISGYDENDPSSYTLYEGTITGGETYQALLTFEAMPGYYFTEDSRFVTTDYDTWDDILYPPLFFDEEHATVVVEVKAEHPWDDEQSSSTPATCSSQGVDHHVCSVDPSHVEDKYYPIDPDAHEWGEWETITEATTKSEGERAHTCELCGTTETEVIPRITLPYAKVYEPETSWPMAATIAWRADDTVLETAKADIRPATVFVWLDADLKVYDRDGGLISDDIDSFVSAVCSTMIPAFYINDAATAAALKTWLADSGLGDCFVVSTPDHADLVQDVADLLYIRGMLDYTSADDPDRKELAKMNTTVNWAHGKVILLSAEAATRENVRRLQSLSATVWVQSTTDTKTLLTVYTNGVNGVLVDDYQTAIDLEGFFADDAPSLLRVPMVIGHRGDPSTYVENTLDSARGAYEEGVSAVENDIQLSADGKLFILHDDTATRLLGITDVDEDGNPIMAESLTLEELQSHPFLWGDIIVSNEVSAENSRYGTLYGQEEEKEYVVPTLEDYILAFQGTDLVHTTEIKSYNPAILPVFKAMVDSYDAWDQLFCITFNKDILETIYREYPEIPIGVLGYAQEGAWFSYFAELDPYQEITEEYGAEAALQRLYSRIDQWNATYDPNNDPFSLSYSPDMVKIGRHRGLTTWMWTYLLSPNPEVDFATNLPFSNDYLSGISGLTTDYPWVAENLLLSVSSEDVTAASEDEIPRPSGTTYAKETVSLDTAVPVKVEEISDTETLMIWKYQTAITIYDRTYGDYYLYSNPFVWTHPDSEQEESETETEEPQSEEPETKVPETETETEAAAVSYFNTKGDGSKWVKGSKTGNEFIFKRSVSDNETFSRFKAVKVDDVTLDPANYTAESGSVVITLTPAYLESLSVGEHTLTAVFNDGSASAKFTIQNKDKNSRAPRTGDHNNPLVWMIMLAASAGVILTLLIKRLHKAR